MIKTWKDVSREDKDAPAYFRKHALPQISKSILNGLGWIAIESAERMKGYFFRLPPITTTCEMKYISSPYRRERQTLGFSAVGSEPKCRKDVRKKIITKYEFDLVIVWSPDWIHHRHLYWPSIILTTSHYHLNLSHGIDNIPDVVRIVIGQRVWELLWSHRLLSRTVWNEDE